MEPQEVFYCKEKKEKKRAYVEYANGERILDISI